MEFLNWHYTKGLELYFKVWEKFLKSNFTYFSLPVLLKTLFSPWKRLTIHQKRKGFNLSQSFDEFSYNATSRVVGFMVRATLILSALIFLIFVSFIGFIGFLVWLIFPFLSYSYYKKHNLQPHIFAQGLAFAHSNSTIQALLNNEAGHFVLNHVGLTFEDFSINTTVSINHQIPFSGFGHLMEHVLESGAINPEFWKSKEIHPDDILLAARIWDSKRQIISGVETFETISAVKGIGIELLFGYTPTLDKVGKELRFEPQRATYLRGRDNILARIDRVLASDRNILMVGLPGVGKSAILLELAHRLDEKYQRLVEVSIVDLTAGITDKNERKIAIQNLLSEVASAGNVVIVLKDIARLTNPAVEGTDYTDVFESQLENKKLKIIAVTTPDEYERFISRNYRLMKYFERVDVEPLGREAATQVLIDKAAELETKTGITLSIPILKKMVTAADRYFSDSPFPKKALELLEATISYAQHHGKSVITFEDVAIIVAEKSGMPVSALTKANKQILSNIENHMQKRIIGQETPLKLIAQSLRSRSMGVSDESRPVGTYLFLGPTGVGKTETAKALSQIYFGHSDIMRFDMAEFVGHEGITKLIGSAHLNQPGILTTAIRNNPAGMLLLDELEKASPEIFNLLLSLIDEGYIMDAFGRKVDCRNIFVIATSNAGSELIRELVNRNVSGEELQTSVIEHIMHERIFAPEFINRFDGVVVYEPLSHDDLTKIANLLLTQLKTRLSEKNIYIEFGEDLFEKVADDGFHPVFGARPMRRLVDNHIGDIISQAILADQIQPGDRIKINPGTNKMEYLLEKII